MTLTRVPTPYTLPGDLLDAIAAGGDGAALSYLIAAQRSKAALLIRATAELAAKHRHPYSRHVRDAYRLLGTSARRSPAKVDSILTYPSVVNWAVHVVAALSAGEPAATPGYLTLVAASATLAAGGEATIAITPDIRHPEGIPLPGLGFLRTHAAKIQIGPGRTVRAGRDTVRLGPQAGPAWSPLGRIHLPGDWSITLDDPHRVTPTPQPLLPPPAIADWQDQLAAGWRQLTDRHPASAASVRTSISSLLPMPSPPAGHVSGSFRHAFGCIGMSLPGDERATAVTLVHELAHMKLSATMDLIQLVDMTSEDRGYAPWRDDPRPPSGLLHGAYAHLAVAGFWRRQAGTETEAGHRLRAQTEYVRWRDSTALVCDGLLASDWLTPPGRRFVRVMATRLAAWSDEPVPAPAVLAASRLNAEHRDRFAAR